MSYAIESIAKSIGARRVGKHKATIDWLLTDSRSLSFPEETLFFALTTKRNSGARYIPDLYDRGVRNFVITEEDFKEVENGELRVESCHAEPHSPLLPLLPCGKRWHLWLFLPSEYLRWANRVHRNRPYSILR